MAPMREVFTMKWLRLYNEVAFDAKVQLLRPELFRAWVNVLCLASGNDERGVVPGIVQVAYTLRVGEAEARAMLAELAAAGLLEARGVNSYAVADWSKRHGRGVREVPRGWAATRARVFRRDNYTCVYCGDKTSKLDCDHIIPVSRGGGHELANLATACFRCNRSKSNKTPREWTR